MKTYFATSNKGKFTEAKELFEKAGLELKQYKVDLLEIQSDSLEEISKASARNAFKSLQKPLFVEDAGIFIKTLKGFPGPYSKYVFFTIGLEGILKLMDRVEERKAEFVSVVTYKDADKEKLFKGTCRGNITHKIKGQGGFGFDPIFIPQNHKKTFAEDFEFKKENSHRAQSVKKLADWLKNG